MIINDSEIEIIIFMLRYGIIILQYYIIIIVSKIKNFNTPVEFVKNSVVWL